MALSPSEAYASKLAALAAQMPHVASLAPGLHHGLDGKLYYYGIYRLAGDTINRHTQQSSSPHTACRLLRTALLA